MRLPERALPWLSVAGVLELFEALPRVGLLPEDHFPPMSLILGELASETTDSAFWSALGHTLETILTDPASAVADRATLDKELSLPLRVVAATLKQRADQHVRDQLADEFNVEFKRQSVLHTLRDRARDNFSLVVTTGVFL